VTAELRRLTRFALVGVGNTLLTVAAFALLVGLAAAPPVASAAAFAVGAVNGYVLNRRWTFAGAQGGPATIARYAAVQGLGAALSAGGVALATTDLSLQHMAAEALVLPCVTLVTYTLARRVVFGGPELA
jgi:putative flippase GtrA